MLHELGSSSVSAAARRTIFLSACVVFTGASGAATAVAQSSKLALEGSFQRLSCSYYSATEASFQLTLRDAGTTADARVTLHVGYEGDVATPTGGLAARDWQAVEDRPLSQTGASEWTVQWNAQLHHRSAPRAPYQGLGFVIRIEEPGREPRYLKPASEWGFYRARWSLQNIPCDRPSTPSPLLLEDVLR